MRQALAAVPGVLDAEVSFEEGRAEVRHTEQLAAPRVLVEAVEKAGFRARLQEPPDRNPPPGEPRR